MPLRGLIVEARVAWAEVARRLGTPLTARTGHDAILELDHQVTGRTIRAIGWLRDGRLQTTVIADAPGFHAHLGREEDLMGVWLSGDVRRHMVATDYYGYVLRGGAVAARRPNLETNAGRLETAIVAVAALAGRGVAILDEWRELAASLGGVVQSAVDEWTPDGATRIEVPGRGVIDNTVAPLASRRRRLLTRVTAPRRGGGAFQILRADIEPLPDGAPADGAPAGYRAFGPVPVPRRVYDLVARCRPLAATSDGDRVTVLMRGLKMDPARLSSALDLGDALAGTSWSASDGPYR